MASSNTDHDVLLSHHIAAAREQWERDTGKCLISRTMRLVVPNIYDNLQLPDRPATAINSIRFYPNDTIETLSTAVYQLDTYTSTLRLGYNQVWPSWAERWDAWEINYTAGDHADSTSVPNIDKAAILLYVGYLFRGNRGDDDRPNDLRAYEALVHRHMRSTYP
jgi:uncharacterized phiE125 gp8 family phage protein